MSKYRFEEISLSNIRETENLNFKDKYIFTTKEWLSFVAEDSKVQLLILRVTNENGEIIGYFYGGIFKRFGIRILGSPFSGWSTCFMGFDLLDRSEQYDIAKAIAQYAYKEKKVLYIEIIDRHFLLDEAEKLGFTTQRTSTLQMPINMDNEALFKQMKTDCRNFIRQFERRGAVLEIAEPDDKFAEEYYTQLIDVFAKQGMTPTYSCDKVKCLLKNLKDSGDLLCLRVRNPEGNPIATSIFFGYGTTFFFWGGASYREHQHYRPNEYMIWTAIQYFRNKGFTTFDMVGVRDYKRKFGSHEETYAKLIFTKFSILLKARNLAKKVYFFSLKVKGKLLRKK